MGQQLGFGTLASHLLHLHFWPALLRRGISVGGSTLRPLRQRLLDRFAGSAECLLRRSRWWVLKFGCHLFQFSRDAGARTKATVSFRSCKSVRDAAYGHAQSQYVFHGTCVFVRPVYGEWWSVAHNTGRTELHRLK